MAQFVPVLREISRPFFNRQAFEFFFKQGLARPERMHKSVLENHWRLAKAEGGTRPILDTWAQFAEGAPSIAVIRDRMKTFDRSVLVLFGADDPFLPPPNAERFAKEFPKAELQLLAGAGHFLQEDAPEVVAERIASFLA
jgi:pimeloyl-ACP methyl ester carboxylesterase